MYTKAKQVALITKLLIQFLNENPRSPEDGSQQHELQVFEEYADSHWPTSYADTDDRCAKELLLRYKASVYKQVILIIKRIIMVINMVRPSLNEQLQVMFNT